MVALWVSPVEEVMSCSTSRWVWHQHALRQAGSTICSASTVLGWYALLHALTETGSSLETDRVGRRQRALGTPVR